MSRFSKELFRRWTYQVFAPGVLLREKYNAFRELLRYDDACLELIAALEDEPTQAELTGDDQ